MSKPLRFTGASVLQNGGLVETEVGMADGVFEAGADGPSLDLTGMVILPGIVDPHGDGFERHLAPRRGAVVEMGLGLDVLEAELLANGITTAMLAQFWSWEGGMRGPDFATELAHAVARHQGSVDLHVLMRLELGCHEDFDAVAALMEVCKIGHLILSDHLPHKALAEGRRVPRLEGQALKSGRSPQAHQALLEALYAGLPKARAALPGFAARLAGRGVRLGSHDDATPKDRADFRAMGFEIAEFPLTLETAQAAHDEGDPIVLGAPNVLRGSSHKRGNMSARDALEAGFCAALASDYFYPAPRRAAAKLVAEGWDLGKAWALVSSGPADVLGMADRGRIADGLRADIVIASADLSRVHGSVSGGKLAYADTMLLDRITR